MGFLNPTMNLFMFSMRNSYFFFLIPTNQGVINATGPFTDGLRKMDDKDNSEIVAPSAGVHIILPNYYSPGNMGLLDPATSDGRVIFFLPWQGNTIAGTTGMFNESDT